MLLFEDMPGLDPLTGIGNFIKQDYRLTTVRSSVAAVDLAVFDTLNNVIYFKIIFENKLV